MEKQTKTCGRCEKEKDIDQFSFIKATGYYASYCKPCANEYQKERNAKKKAEEKSPDKVFANILARKRLTDD